MARGQATLFRRQAGSTPAAAAEIYALLNPRAVVRMLRALRSTALFRHGLVRLRRDGFHWLASAAFHRLFPAHPALTPAAMNAVERRRGLEIGGPSHLFSRRGILPLYPRVAQLDNVNFASQTAWEAGLQDGGEFNFEPGQPPGRQFLREATALGGIADQSYDFILSSHCLEHVANPLRALQEWRRVVRSGGFLIILLPDPRGTFDCARPVTTLAHLEDDLAQNRTEDDLTHLPEILRLHDLGRDPHAGTAEEFRMRAAQNAENRCLHHHVFDLALLRRALEATGWEVCGCEHVRPIHLVAIARNPAPPSPCPATPTTTS